MICARCPEEAERVIESESGTACLCGHCAESWFLIHLQRDELSGTSSDLRFDDEGMRYQVTA